MSDVQLTVVEGDIAQVIGAIPGPQGPAGAVAAAIDGSAALPSIAFASDTDTGLYRVGANQLGVSTGGTQRLVIDSNGQIEATSLGTAAAPTWTFVGDPDTGAYSPGANQFAISTGGTGRLFVDASGNVATGVAAYSKALTINNVNAAIALRANSGGAYSDQGIFFAVDGTNYSQIYNDGVGQLIFRTGSSLSERLRITSTGNVGIGTSSPEAGHLLQANGVIASVTSFGGFSALQSAGGTGFRWTLANNGTFRLQRTTDGFASVTTPILIDSSDRVGIGTTSPEYKLDVLPDAGGAALRVRGGSGGSSIVQFTDNAVSAQWGNVTTTSSSLNILHSGVLQFSPGGSEKARIDSSGRLLVGTSTNTGGSLFQVNDNRIRIATAKTPASATDTGSAGEICWDANYIYVCTATNTWKRTAIATW